MKDDSELVMKMKTTLQFILAASVLQTMALKAEDWFVINWSGTQYYTTDAGKVVAKSYSSRDVLNQIASNVGVSPSDLLLVYRPLRFDIAAIMKDNPAITFDYLQIPDPNGAMVDMSNASGTQTVRHAFIFDEAHGGSGGSPIGTIFATESQRWNSDHSQQLSESFHGKFQFSNTRSDDPILPVGVFTGSFSTGRRITGGQ